MDDMVKIFKILGDRNRLRIIALLSGGRRLCVCELASVLGVTQPSISRHINKMKSAGLLGEEQDGFWTNYFLKPSNPQTSHIIDYANTRLTGNTTVAEDIEKLENVDRTTVCKYK